MPSAQKGNRNISKNRKHPTKHKRKQKFLSSTKQTKRKLRNEVPVAKKRKISHIPKPHSALQPIQQRVEESIDFNSESPSDENKLARNLRRGKPSKITTIDFDSESSSDENNSYGNKRFSMKWEDVKVHEYGSEISSTSDSSLESETIASRLRRNRQKHGS